MIGVNSGIPTRASCPRWRAGAFFCAVWLGAGAAPAAAETLAEVVATAVSSHPTVGAAVAGRRAAELDVTDARADFFPSVDVEAESGWEHADSPTTRRRLSAVSGEKDDSTDLLRTLGQVTVRQKLFDGFERGNRTEAARRRHTAAGHALVDRREAIALRAVEAFNDVWRARDVVRLAQTNVDAHVEVRDDVRFRVDSGGGDAADLNQAESRLALARSRLAEARGDLRVAESAYLEVVGAMPGTLEAAERPTGRLPASAEDAVPTALDNNPALQAARLDSEAARYDKRAARAPLLPTVDLELRGSRGSNIGGVVGSDLNAQALVVLRYNLYRGGRDTARARRAIALESEAQQRRAELARRVEEQVRVDFHDMETAGETVPLLQARADAAAEVVSAYRQQFELGRRSLLDVLDVENELFQARTSVVNADTEHRVAEYRVLATMGLLMASLGVAPDGSLPVPEADPAEEAPQPEAPAATE